MSNKAFCFTWKIIGNEVLCNIFTTRSQSIKAGRKCMFTYNVRDSILNIINIIFFIDGHVCLLKERFDQDGLLRWSLPLMERCYCQKVVAPIWLGTGCPNSLKQIEHMELWFTNDPLALIETKNWTPAYLDLLLERKEYCGGYKFNMHDTN